LVASVAWPLATVGAKRTQRLHGVRFYSMHSIATAARRASRKSPSSTSMCMRRAGGGRPGREPEGRGSTEIRGSTPCKTNCPCTSAGGVERGQGTAALAGQRRCRTAAAGCTAGCPRAPRRVTQMLSSTDTTRLKQSRVGARLRSCYGTRGLL
jgi:hypothetical protein